MFLRAGGDLALICRDGSGRSARGRGHRERDRPGRRWISMPAVRRRRAVRQLVEAAGPRPDLSVIGSAEHRALGGAEEVVRRAARAA